MTATTQTLHRTADTTGQVAAGAVGGLAGGIPFGIMMQAGGMLPAVASLVGGESVGLGWAVHLAISVVLGVGYAVLLRGRRPRVAAGAGLGAAYGVLWWVLGALLIMPAAMGMPVLQVNAMSLTSLVGHVIFGVVLGAVHAVVRHRGSR